MGHYEVLYPLERSSAPATFLVREEDRNLVLRLLTVDPSDPAAIAAAIDLRRSLAHPLLPRPLGLGWRGRRPGIFFEHLPPLDLDGLLGSPATAGRITAIAARLADLLCFLHSRQQCLGYLAPSRLLGATSRRLQVSINLPGDSGLPSDPRAVVYCGPRLLQTRQPSREDDVFSLGRLFYRLFTGRPPISERDASRILSKQLTTRPPDPRSVAPELPEPLAALIESMIRRHATERPSAAEVHRTLSRLAPDGDRLQPGLTAPLVGRRRGLGQLAAACARLRSNPTGRALLVRGPKGVGKSRLLQTLGDVAVACRLPAFRWSPDHDHIRLDDLGAAGAAGISGLSPVDAVAALNRLASGGPPVVILSRDIDPAALEPLAGLVRDPAGALVALEGGPRLRPAEVLRSLQDLPVETVDLAPLPLRDMDRLAGLSLGQATGAQPRSLRRLSRLGRPLYWHELADRLVEAGQLTYRAGFWTPGASAESDEPPETLAQQLGRRLELLSPEARLLLESLAALAGPQPFQLLLHIGDWEQGRLEELLCEIETAEFVSASGELDDPCFGIDHGWIRGLIEAALKPEQKRSRHRRVARALARFAADTAASPAIQVTIAEQRIEAGLDPDPYLWRAADYLKREQRFGAASRLMDRAVEAGLIAGDSHEFVAEHIELLLLSGDLSGCARLINRCLSRPATKPQQRAHLYWLLGRMHLVRGERREAIGAFEHALTYSPHAETLDAELKCELLCLSALSGDGRPSASLREELRRRAEEQHDPPEKLWHALFVDAFFGSDGSADDALRYAARSVKALTRGGDSVRLLGRVFNVSHSLLQVGRCESGRRMSSFVRRAARETGNRELIAYAEMSRLLNWRRDGKHGQILQETVQQPGPQDPLHRNPHLAVERRLERARSLLYSGRLDDADQLLTRLESSPLQFRPSDFELRLIRGWWLWSVGRRGDAEQVARALAPDRPHHFYGRAWLLLARCLLDDDPTAAAEAAGLALSSFSRSLPYHRAKALLALSAVRRRQGRETETAQLLTRARALLPTGRYPALTAAVLVNQASQQRRAGELRLARALCLRALQIAREVERPLLKPRLLVELARIERQQGQRRIAAARLDEAIGTVRSVAGRLPAQLRSQFCRSRLNPLLVLSWRLFGGNRELPADLLAALSRFSRGESAPSQTAGALSKAVREHLPNASLRVLLSQADSGRLRAAASLGRMAVSSRELVREARDRRDEALLTRFHKGTTVCGLPLRRNGALLGLIHLETPDELIEAELDFLSCLATLTTYRLPVPEAPKHTSTADVSAVQLGGGRRLIVRSAAMKRVVEFTTRLAGSSAAAIVEGETGTGKELVSRLIHAKSCRRQGPFVPLHCGALPEELIENELFGNLEGSFTGARGKRGLFEAASGGTLFLDEIASMPPPLQSRLLRVLQERRIRRIGDHVERPVDVRIVAATNRSLKTLVAQGEFREDLYHRLNVFQVEIPPLRKRPDDVGPLVRYFLQALNRQHERSISVSSGALQLLRAHHYPGNVRELQNLIESLFHTCREGLITASAVDGRVEPCAGFQEADDPAERILAELTSGRQNFWNAVREPFLRRDLSRREVRGIVAGGLAVCDGSYRRLTTRFGIAPEDYKKFLNFLRDHRCRVDFRPYRERAKTGR